jgi:5'-3' exonuclease
MHALIDGDILTYRVGFTTENDDFNIAKARIDDLLDRILEAVKADRFTIFLSDSTENNYRYQMYPLYKANRKQPKPKHLEGLKYYLAKEHLAIMTAEQEADDALGITQCKYENKGKSIICSIDKDLLQIPGWHYNFVNEEISHMTHQNGMRFFYKQLLMGDKADNIPCLYGIGPAKADKLLEEKVFEDECFQVVLDAYLKHKKLEGTEEERLGMLLLYGRLLKIRTKENELWNFPQTFQELQPKAESKLSYLRTKAEETLRSLELTTQEIDGFHQLGQSQEVSS